jgi:hypothetical protein
MTLRYLDGFVHYPSESWINGSRYFMNKGDPIQMSWENFVEVPTFWERLKQVFFPKRSPVTLVMNLDFKSGEGQLESVEALCVIPDRIGCYRLNARVWKNGQVSMNRPNIAIFEEDFGYEDQAF